MLSTISPERRAILSQLVRFLISGALVTLLGVAVYAIVALVLGWHPQLGNLLAYLVAALILMNLRVLKHRLFGRLRDSYTGLLMSALLLGLGVIMVIEFGYHLSLESARSSVALLFGLPFDAAAGSTWVLAVGTTLGAVIEGGSWNSCGTPSHGCGPASTYPSPLPSATWQRSRAHEPIRRMSRTSGRSLATQPAWCSRTARW